MTERLVKDTMISYNSLGKAKTFYCILVSNYSPMSRNIELSIFFFMIIFMNSYAQKIPIKIEDELVNNRIDLYAINENLKDFDILVTIRGTGFRQRGGAPRLTRITGASRTKVKSLIIERGKQPVYTYFIVANDSLSRRVIKPEYTKIKVDAPLRILVYTNERCKTCDTLFSTLDTGMYKYDVQDLSNNPEKIEALKKYIPSIESLTTPIVSLGGKLYTDIETYDQIIKKLNN